MVNRLFAFNVKDFRASYGDLIKEAFDGGIQNVDIKNQEVSIKVCIRSPVPPDFFFHFGIDRNYH